MLMSPELCPSGWHLFVVKVVCMEPLSAHRMSRAGRWMLSVVIPSWLAHGHWQKLKGVVSEVHRESGYPGEACCFLFHERIQQRYLIFISILRVIVLGWVGSL